ncbi:MAG: exo-alpha-sialidase [Candidatus Hydrogenedentes bacterium]|nr:exo-alpha-sialidase [Candidatus Hydrogenedentota bacterium]
MGVVGTVSGVIALLAGPTAASEESPKPYPLWDAAVPVPTAAEAPVLDDVRFEQIKKREPDVDGFNWLHGVAAVWHKDALFTFWGHNKGDENTPTEIAQGRHSTDGGRTWSPVWLVAPHTDTEARSHGVFLSHEGALWIFLARFGAGYTHLKTEAFVLNEAAPAPDGAPGVWEPRGDVATGIWPCDEPRRMANGNWIFAGMDTPDGSKWAWPAVAISHGDDFTQWDTIRLPISEDLRTIWGESTVIVEEDALTVIIRPSGKDSYALVSTSADFGATWTPVQWANLPTPSTKLYAGRLATGQRYVVGTLVRDHGRQRHPLCIAVSKPGERALSTLWRIRDDVFAEGPGESAAGTRLSYPYAAEHDGALYVVYSNDGNRGRNRNSAELAVIPTAALAVP